MSLILDLPPELERRLETEAARNGTSTQNFAVQLLAKSLPSPARSRRRPEELAQASQALAERIKADKAAWEALSEEEKAEAEGEFVAFRKAMNANRKATGERILYPEVEE